jgi:hypothetical protein
MSTMSKPVLDAIEEVLKQHAVELARLSRDVYAVRRALSELQSKYDTLLAKTASATQPPEPVPSAVALSQLDELISRVSKTQAAAMSALVQIPVDAPKLWAPLVRPRSAPLEAPKAPTGPRRPIMVPKPDPADE